MKEVRPDEVEPRENARILKCAVSPRPIAWISTRSEDGVDNLAPFSSYNYVGYHPPVVLFNSPTEGSGRFKDTACNVFETGEFAINVVTEELLKRMDHTSEPIPTDESEFELVGIERGACQTIAAPRVADAVLTMECTFYESLDVYERTMILGEVRYFHIDDAVLTDGEIDMNNIATVGRLGGPYYTIADPTEFERQF